MLLWISTWLGYRGLRLDTLSQLIFMKSSRSGRRCSVGKPSRCISWRRSFLRSRQNGICSTKTCSFPSRPTGELQLKNFEILRLRLAVCDTKNYSNPAEIWTKLASFVRGTNFMHVSCWIRSIAFWRSPFESENSAKEADLDQVGTILSRFSLLTHWFRYLVRNNTFRP